MAQTSIGRYRQCMTSHGIPPTTRVSRRARLGAAALAVGLAVAAVAVVAPALAATTIPQHLIDQKAACLDMAAVAQTHAEKAWAEHCNTLADRAIELAGELEPTATPTVAPSPTATVLPPSTPAPTTIAPTTTPPAAGWPNADNTGPTGTLIIRNGGMTIGANDVVVENLDIRGCVEIRGARVQLRNVRVTGCTSGLGAVRVVSPGGVIISNAEIVCDSSIKGVVGEGFTLTRSEVRRCEDAVYIDRNANVIGNYLHSLYENVADPHTDVVQVVNGGANVLIEGNFMSNRTSRPTSGYMGDGPTSNIVIRNNLIESGNWVVYCSSSGSFTVTGNTIRVLSRDRGAWYPTTCYRSGIDRSGNTIINS